MNSITEILFDKWTNNPVERKDEYKSKLSSGVWIVEFEKVNGEVTVMECTLDPTLLPPINENTDSVARTENETLIHVYALDRGGWRSFKVANVKSFQPK